MISNQKSIHSFYFLFFVVFQKKSVRSNKYELVYLQNIRKLAEHEFTKHPVVPQPILFS